MPGLSFLYDPKEFLLPSKQKYRDFVSNLIYNEHYTNTIFIDTKHFFLTSTHYHGYPITFFDTDHFSFYLEGKIYNQNPLNTRTEIIDLLRLIQTHSFAESSHSISHWLSTIDGDFITLALDKSTGFLFILNDILGRLPLYYIRRPNGLILSREINFLFQLSMKTLDKMSLAQYFLFGYSLGSRTLFDDIRRVGPGTLITINSITSLITIQNVNMFNFELKNNRNTTVNQNALNLFSLFSEASRTRHEFNCKNIVSLSGGLDSRTVAACLNRNDIPFTAATFLESNKTSSLDSTGAAEVANLLKIDWRLIPLPPPTGKDLQKLLNIKLGQNYLGMAFILPFFENLVKDPDSSINYWTGDGGDKTLPDLRPKRYLSHLNMLVKYIIYQNQVFPLKVVENLTKLEAKHIFGDIESHVMSYPEDNLDQKYVHFIIYERAFNWLFEGEDRNRFYFWTVTPFYSTSFFKYAMECPDQQKYGHSLYRNFLLQLTPELVTLGQTPWSYQQTWRKHLIDITERHISMPLLGRLKQAIKSHRDTMKYGIYQEFLRKHLNDRSVISSYIELPRLQEIIHKCNRKQLMVLLTLTLIMRKIGGQDLKFNDYENVFFKE